MVLTPRERAEIDRGLARLDTASRRGLWTRRVLEVVRQRPGVSPAELARHEGRPTGRMKSDVWRLTELGLIDKVSAGLRLSARGASYLDDVDDR